MQHLELDLGRQRRREAADVERRLVPAFGLDEDLMRRIVRELDDLVFDRGAVARTDPADQIETVERRTVQILAHQRVRSRVRFGDVTRKLRSARIALRLAYEKSNGRGLGGWQLHRTVVDAVACRSAAACRS